MYFLIFYIHAFANSIDALKIVMQRHWSVIGAYWLDLLSCVPSSCDPTRLKEILPTQIKGFF